MVVFLAFTLLGPDTAWNALSIENYSTVPIEVKAGENLRSKSLRTFVERHAGLKGVRFSLSPHRDQGWMENIPLYAANAWARDAAKRDFAAASKKECLPSFRQSTTKEKQP